RRQTRRRCAHELRKSDQSSGSAFLVGAAPLLPDSGALASGDAFGLALDASDRPPPGEEAGPARGEELESDREEKGSTGAVGEAFLEVEREGPERRSRPPEGDDVAFLAGAAA